MKKTIFSLFLAFVLSFSVQAQQEFSVVLEALDIVNAPSAHSFSWAKTSDDKWLIVGGRIDGLHQRQPFAAFLETENNKNAFLIDPITEQVWTQDLSSLPSAVFEQLQSTNQQFFQRENTLYITGGYGFSAFLNDHITYPHLIAIDVDALATSIINSTAISSSFRQINDESMAVTGGQLGYLDSVFYLCGGQLFEGRYNPMGPTFGPGFIQEYTEEIRKFKIEDDGVNMTITDYSAENDPTNLHRRDYNMSPQIFPNGERGFTMFSGVFNALDLPYLNSVDVTENGYTVNNVFNQYLSQYHSAKVPLYDENTETMHTVFFGGLSQYTLDSQGALVEDQDVPFVKTISVVTRNADGSMEEKKLSIEMPTLLGAGAEFIPITDENLYLDHEIVDLNKITEKTLVGYIYGGIESSEANIFFTNTGTQSSASGQIFKVFITAEKDDVSIVSVAEDNPFELNVYPNPIKDSFTLEAKFNNLQNYVLKIYDLEGKEVQRKVLEKLGGIQKIKIEVNSLAQGEYLLLLSNDSKSSKQKIYIK